MNGNAEFDEGTGIRMKGERKRRVGRRVEGEERAQKMGPLKGEEEKVCQCATMVIPGSTY